MDNRTGKWSDELTDDLGLDKQKFGEIVSALSIIGTIQSFGRVRLPYAVPVLPGVHDAIAGFIGMGVCSSNHILAEVTGTFDHVGYIENGYVNVFQKNPSLSVWSSRGPFENTSSVIGVFQTSGALLEWYMKNVLFDNSEDNYDKLWEKINFDAKNNLYISPDFANGHGAIANLSIASSKEDIFKAIIETLTFETRKCLENCEEAKQRSRIQLR